MEFPPLVTLSDYLAFVTLSINILGWLLFLLVLGQSKRKFKRGNKNEIQDIEAQVGVTVLKPLCGLDPNLRENLASFFQIDYSKFEILICVQEESDPAIQIAQDVLQQFPHVDAQLLIGGKPVGINPKINNIDKAYTQSKYPFVLISDCNIRAECSTLLDVVSCINEQVAVVYQFPYTADRPGFAAAVEKVFFATAGARCNITNDLVGAKLAVGMSCLVRKSALDDVGGLKAFGEYLGEDVAMSFKLYWKGWKIVLCYKPCFQNSGVSKVSLFNERLLRWMKLRFTLFPPGVLGEIISECLVQGVLASWAVYHLFHINPALMFVGHSVVFCLFDWLLLRSVQNGPLDLSVLTYILAWSCQTLCAPFLILKAILTCPVVKWKNNTFRLRLGGKAIMVHSGPV